MRVDLFDFELPDDRIALRPAEPRESAKLLHVVPGAPLNDVTIADLPRLLRAGDALVVNDTRVLPARLTGTRTRGEYVARMEATLHKREDLRTWRAFLRPFKKINAGEAIVFAATQDPSQTLVAEVIEKGQEGEVLLRFDVAGAELEAALVRVGDMPLPPYIASKRTQDSQDAHDYQTLFANESGAVAAPTAGLHFTPALVAALQTAGIQLHKVTLHVGAGTFLPVKADDTDNHKMHAEYGVISPAVAASLNDARARGGRIVSVGTTSLRILESATTADGVVQAFSGDTSIFITPGYTFRAVDVLLTNFHLPKSTLFMLVSAFSGLDTMRAAYAHAIAKNYRFYSYGDACLLELA